MMDQYVCLNRQGWFNIQNGSPMHGPKLNEVVTFHSAHPRNEAYLCFLEYPATDDIGWPYDGFHGRHFVKLVTDAVLSKELESITKPVEV